MKKSGKIAFGSVLSALSLVFMLLTVVPTLTYALPAIAGVVFIPVVLEIDRKWAWACYAVVALLSLLLVPEWECKLLFILFFGYYPILKATLERIRFRVAEWAAKLLLFNAAMIVTYWLLVALLKFPLNSFTLFGVELPWVFLLMGNGIFVVYDLAINNLVTLYWRRMHPLFSRIFH